MKRRRIASTSDAKPCGLCKRVDSIDVLNRIGHKGYEAMKVQLGFLGYSKDLARITTLFTGSELYIHRNCRTNLSNQVRDFHKG